MTKDQQQLHLISVLQALQGSAQQADLGSAQLADLADRVAHGRDALFSAVKSAVSAQKKIWLLTIKSLVHSAFLLQSVVKLFLVEFPGTVQRISVT